MVLVFTDKKQRDEMLKDVGLIYEYYDKAGKMSINGRPIFFSARMASVEDTKKIFAKCKEIEHATERVMKPKKTEEKEKEKFGQLSFLEG